MALARRYDGEPIVRVELDTSVELDVSVNGSRTVVPTRRG